MLGRMGRRRRRRLTSRWAVCVGGLGGLQVLGLDPGHVTTLCNYGGLLHTVPGPPGPRAGSRPLGHFPQVTSPGHVPWVT